MGSNPIARSNPIGTRVSAVSIPSGSAQKANAHALREAIEAFLLTKQVGGCTQATIRTNRWWLERFAAAISEVSPLAVRTFFAGLQHHSASHQHQACRTLKTFCRWGLQAGLFLENPLRGFTMRAPRTLPVVPTEDDLRAVLAVCPQTLEGVRNRGLILTLADAGLRASEALHLLIEDWRPTDRGLFVRAGKGRKDRVAFVGATTTRALKAWLARHPVPSAESFLFTDRRGQPLKPRHLVQILHRLNRKAQLPDARRLHPHALRHFAATSWLRGGAGLDEVRRAIERLNLD